MTPLPLWHGRVVGRGPVGFSHSRPVRRSAVAWANFGGFFGIGPGTWAGRETSPQRASGDPGGGVGRRGVDPAAAGVLEAFRDYSVRIWGGRVGRPPGMGTWSGRGAVFGRIALRRHYEQEETSYDVTTNRGLLSRSERQLCATFAERKATMGPTSVSARSQVPRRRESDPLVQPSALPCLFSELRVNACRVYRGVKCDERGGCLLRGTPTIFRPPTPVLPTVPGCEAVTGRRRGTLHCVLRCVFV